MTKELHPVEVLSFRKGDNLATIATDGSRHISQEFTTAREHASLTKAIAYLCAKGYVIDPSNFKSIPVSGHQKKRAPRDPFDCWRMPCAECFFYDNKNNKCNHPEAR